MQRKYWPYARLPGGCTTCMYCIHLLPHEISNFLYEVFLAGGLLARQDDAGTRCACDCCEGMEVGVSELEERAGE